MTSGRGFGPLSEQIMMDKISRQSTRDIGAIWKFINGESDRKKRDALSDLYHQMKFFVDLYDGCTAEVRATPTFGRHATHMWTEMMGQKNGRKILLVQMGGISTGCDTWYWHFWTTCQGISAAEISLMKVQLDIWKAVAATKPPEEVETIVDESESSDAEVVALIDAIASNNIISIVPGQAVTTDTATSDAERVEGDVDTDDTAETPVPVEKGDVTLPTMDSGVADVSTVTSPQTLPKPNLTIVGLDDTIDDEDDEWFDDEARIMISQSTPTIDPALQNQPSRPDEIMVVSPAPMEQVSVQPNASAQQGKITIQAIADTFHVRITESARTFSSIYKMTEFVRAFYINDKKWANPKISFLGRPSNIENYGRPKRTDNIVSGRPQRRNPRIGQIGRQNALREKTPNSRNYRLHGRKGSRGNSGSGARNATSNAPAPAPAPANEHAVDAIPNNLATEIAALQNRLRELERMFKK